MYRLGSGIGLVSVLILRLCALKLIFKLISIGDSNHPLSNYCVVGYLTGFFWFSRTSRPILKIATHRAVCV